MRQARKLLLGVTSHRACKFSRPGPVWAFLVPGLASWGLCPELGRWVRVRSPVLAFRQSGSEVLAL